MTQKRLRALYYNLDELINVEYWDVPYSGLRIAGMIFNPPFLRCNECNLIVLAVMRLLIKYAYTTESTFGKFTITYVLETPSFGSIPYSINDSIIFRAEGKDLPVYALIDQRVRIKAEEYNDTQISHIFLRIYLKDMKASAIPNISLDEIVYKLSEWINYKGSEVPREDVRTLVDSKGLYPKSLTSLKPSSKERKPFIVADTETVLINDVHVPYAVGFLEVRPGDVLSSNSSKKVETYYSTDYPDCVYKTFEEMSDKMLFDFIDRLAVVVRQNPSMNTVYFHNLARFDGILLLKYLVHNSVKYTVKPLMRNNLVYEIRVYRGKKLLFRLRDSLRLLPNKLDSLAFHLCPQLGSKGTIQHDEIRVSNLLHNREKLLDYMKQDILLLGGVMLKAQDLYWSMYKVDIVTKLTLSSLALCIFRTHYYDQDHFNIHIPSKNEDTFIRRGYYGGHADAYIPKGENLYYYDVNSLYPYIMKTYSMPDGKPVWHGHLEGQDLNNLFGFIEAYVECPPHITRPFLPYKDKKKGTLLFATGEFVGVYYSEELKYARDLGYKIIPLSGYLFENKNSSPFGSFVSDIFGRRQEAKSEGNEAMSYIYKILMNSLYGRFGINPKFTTTEICDFDRYNHLLMKTGFMHGDKITEDKYLVSYRCDDTEDFTSWRPPRISAVQLSAAITACARIHMYKYISREDCYYTDTDSVVLGSRLPDDEVSPNELGKLKLECSVREGIFLAPKSYMLYPHQEVEPITQEVEPITKQKGVGKILVNKDWFELQYKNPSRKIQSTVESPFRIDWENLNIFKKYTNVNLGITTDKRGLIYDDNNNWVGTAPIVVNDISDHDKKRLLEYEVKCLKEVNVKNIELLTLKDRVIANLKSQLEKVSNQSDKKPNFKKIYDKKPNFKKKYDKKPKKKKPG